MMFKRNLQSERMEEDSSVFHREDKCFQNNVGTYSPFKNQKNHQRRIFLDNYYRQRGLV
jgi:hypothetical protein